MAANTVTGQAILFKVARDVGALKAAWITSKTDVDTFACAGLTEDSDDFYNRALIRRQGGSTYATVNDYTGSTKTFDVSADLSISVGDLVEFCWWNPDERSAAFAAINEAIRAAFPFWYREVVTEAASGITLAAGDDDYDLPAACDALMAVGVGADPILWIPAVEPDGRENYRVEGQPGAFVLRLARRYSRVGSIADEYDTQNLALHYATKEPELTSETGQTQLPLDYFTIASSIYVRQGLNDASRLDLVVQNVNLPQIQLAAEQALQKLGIIKRPPFLLGTRPQAEDEGESRPVGSEK